MQNKKFNEYDLAGRLIFLDILREENFAILFTFNDEVEEYLKNEYPQYCDITNSSSLILGRRENRTFHGCLVDINPFNNSFYVKKVEYVPGDADTVYDDSSYRIWTCFNYPKGIEIKFPLKMLKEINIIKKEVQGIK